MVRRRWFYLLVNATQKPTHVGSILRMAAITGLDEVPLTGGPCYVSVPGDCLASPPTNFTIALKRATADTTKQGSSYRSSTLAQWHVLTSRNTKAPGTLLKSLFPFRFFLMFLACNHPTLLFLLLLLTQSLTKCSYCVLLLVNVIFAFVFCQIKSKVSMTLSNCGK